MRERRGFGRGESTFTNTNASTSPIPIPGCGPEKAVWVACCRTGRVPLGSTPGVNSHIRREGEVQASPSPVAPEGIPEMSVARGVPQ